MIDEDIPIGPATNEPEYVWIVNWEKHQDALRKRGKPWSPPWVKLEPSLLDHDDFNELPEGTQLLFLKLVMLFARTRLTVRSDTRSLSRSLGQRVTKQQLERLNRAGFIEICSRTVLEQKRNTFWNSSSLDKRREEKTLRSTQDQPKAAEPPAEQPYDPTHWNWREHTPHHCRFCRLPQRDEHEMAHHIENCHWMDTRDEARALAAKAEAEGNTA